MAHYQWRNYTNTFHKNNMMSIWNQKFEPNAHPTRYNSKPIRTDKGKRDRCGLALTLSKNKPNNKKIARDCKNGIQFAYNKVIHITL